MFLNVVYLHFIVEYIILLIKKKKKCVIYPINKFFTTRLPDIIIKDNYFYYIT